MRYLFFASLGPVQSFIAAARKVRDLYAGSWVLSEITKAAARRLARYELIFPFATEAELGDREFTAVNKLLAMVEVDHPANLAREVKQAALDHLRQLAGRVSAPGEVLYDGGRLLAHLENVLEFYAAWIPFGGAERYCGERELVEQMFNARKRLNAFEPHTGLPGFRKSSLDGGRETVILRRGESARNRARLRDAEELDGPGFLKRFVDITPQPRFESTTEAAVLPYVRKLERLAQTDVEVALSLGALRGLSEEAGLRWDSGELLFEHESREVFPNGDTRREALRSLRKKLHDSEAGAPDPPYYALIQADGDDMGEKLRGLTLEEHRQLSRGLVEFSRTVRRQLKELECMPIFAGGDELLAVLPLHRLREAAWAVHREFGKVKAGAAKVTLSAGIAIVHALEPLDEARAQARQAARDAKAEPDKDAVSIRVCPRSGAPVQSTGKWEAMGVALEEIAGALRRDRLSFGFAHELRDLLDRTSLAGIDDVVHKMALETARKKQKDQSAAPGLVEAAKDRDGLEAFTNRILVARKIARAERDAGVGAEAAS